MPRTIQTSATGPRTGEDPYHAFLGVPILRGGRVIGVLAVQNRTHRTYDDEEVETLQTIAMVLAEIVSSEANDASGVLTGLGIAPLRPIEDERQGAG